jgi:Sulfotransferase family
MREDPMAQPVAVHIGFHKTATTWLQSEVFPNHPQLRPYVTGPVWDNPFLRCIVADSDRDFDAEQARTAYETGLDGLVSVGPDKVVVISAERLSGHAASGGYDTMRIARRLHEALPEARVLIVVRSQIDMIESEYRQLVGEGYRGRISSIWNTDAWKRVQFDLGHYEYDTLVREYHRLFGAENVAVFTYEGLGTDRSRFLERLSTFFGVEPFNLGAAASTRDVHPGLPNRGLGLLRMLNHFRRTELNPFPTVNIGVWWRGPIVAVSRALPRRRHLIPAAKRQELAERFREPNARLAALLPEEDIGPFLDRLAQSVR